MSAPVRLDAAMVDYSQGACVGNEPEMWADYGTPEAHRLCRACPVRTGCLRDAKAEHATGVMRANQIFATTARNRTRTEQRAARRHLRDANWAKWLTMHNEGMSYSAIGKATGYDRTTVQNAVKKLGGA